MACVLAPLAWKFFKSMSTTSWANDICVVSGIYALVNARVRQRPSSVRLERWISPSFKVMSTGVLLVSETTVTNRAVTLSSMALASWSLLELTKSTPALHHLKLATRAKSYPQPGSKENAYGPAGFNERTRLGVSIKSARKSGTSVDATYEYTRAT